MLRTLLSVILVSLLSWPAFALDITPGAIDCETWLQERHDPHTWAASPRGAWLIGFIEGYNFGCPNGGHLLATGLDSEGVYERVDRICSATRTRPLLLAALDLVKELDPQHSDVCLADIPKVPTPLQQHTQP
jgi:hypothetical protein